MLFRHNYYDGAYGSGWQLEYNFLTDAEHHIIVGYGDILFSYEQNSGQINLNNFDCITRIVDDAYYAFYGTPEEYSEYDLIAFSEAFEDSLGFMNIYNLQDIFWDKPFVHFEVDEDTQVDFEVRFPGVKTFAEPEPIIKRGNLKWNNFPAKASQENEIIYEAAFDSRLNFIHFDIGQNRIKLKNRVPYLIDNIFIFKYVSENKYLLAELEILEANSIQNINLSREYKTKEIRQLIKDNFYQKALENGLKSDEANHIVNDFIWIESLLRRAKDHPADLFGFYHFNGELYDRLAPYRCQPRPEKVERNAWVMLSNIKNREVEPVIDFPNEFQDNNQPISQGFFLKAYGVADEHYSRNLTREELQELFPVYTSGLWLR